MSDQHTDIAAVPALASPTPSRRGIATKAGSKPHRVTGTLAVALKHVIETGAELDQAAAHANTTTRALRLALEKPHVIQWMKAEREVFRALICAQNIHYAREMRNEAGNAMARLGAMKFIEGIGDDPSTASGAVRSPGFQIVIVNQGAASPPAARVVEHVELGVNAQSTPDED